MFVSFFLIMFVMIIMVVPFRTLACLCVCAYGLSCLQVLANCTIIMLRSITQSNSPLPYWTGVSAFGSFQSFHIPGVYSRLYTGWN